MFGTPSFGSKTPSPPPPPPAQKKPWAPPLPLLPMHLCPQEMQREPEARHKPEFPNNVAYAQRLMRPVDHAWSPAESPSDSSDSPSSSTESSEPESPSPPPKRPREPSPPADPPAKAPKLREAAPRDARQDAIVDTHGTDLPVMRAPALRRDPGRGSPPAPAREPRRPSPGDLHRESPPPLRRESARESRRDGPRDPRRDAIRDSHMGDPPPARDPPSPQYETILSSSEESETDDEEPAAAPEAPPTPVKRETSEVVISEPETDKGADSADSAPLRPFGAESQPLNSGPELFDTAGDVLLLPRELKPSSSTWVARPVAAAATATTPISDFDAQVCVAVSVAMTGSMHP